MNILSGIFNAAYNNKTKNIERYAFGTGNEIQLERLEDFVNELNADGLFSAEITTVTDVRNLTSLTPILAIKEKASGCGQMFWIDYGYEPFGGTTTLRLSPSSPALLFGKAGGYDLTDDEDYTELLREIGASVAENILRQSLNKKTIEYMNI